MKTTKTMKNNTKTTTTTTKERRIKNNDDGLQMNNKKHYQDGRDENEEKEFSSSSSSSSLDQDVSLSPSNQQHNHHNVAMGSNINIDDHEGIKDTKNDINETRDDINDGHNSKKTETKDKTKTTTATTHDESSLLKKPPPSSLSSSSTILGKKKPTPASLTGTLSSRSDITTKTTHTSKSTSTSASTTCTASSPASLELARTIHGSDYHNLECHDTLRPHVSAAAEPLMFYAIVTGWVLDPTGKYVLYLERVADGLRKKGSGQRSIYAQVVRNKDGTYTIIKIGRSNNQIQTDEQRYEGLETIVICQNSNFDYEMEQQLSTATETYCTTVSSDEECPRPQRILCEMTLNQEGHRLGLKSGYGHQLSEYGLQKYHSLPRIGELGTHPQVLEDNCWTLMKIVFLDMLDSVSSFAKRKGMDVKTMIGLNVLFIGLSSWIPNLDEEMVIVTPTILNTVWKLNCWLDPFKNPAIKDAKTSTERYSNDYDKESHKEADLRTKATLDSLGSGIDGLIQQLQALGDDVKVHDQPDSETGTPSFTTLLVDTNRTLDTNHRNEFLARGYEKIYESGQGIFEEALVELWIRHDSLIIYHSPPYRATCSTSGHTDGHTTTEPVRRSTSIMDEVIRQFLDALRDPSTIPDLLRRREVPSGRDDPNLIEAYLVRRIASAGLHVGQYVATAVWKQYVYLGFADGSVNCFLRNNLRKTKEGTTFQDPSNQRSRKVFLANLKSHEPDDDDDDDDDDSGDDDDDDDVPALSDRAGTKVVDRTVYTRASNLLSNIHISATEEHIVDTAVSLLKEDATADTFNSRLDTLIKSINHRGLKGRFEQVKNAARVEKVNKGNTTTVRSTKQFTKAKTQQTVDSIEDICSTAADPKVFWIQRNGNDSKKPTNRYEIPIFTTYMYAGLKNTITKGKWIKKDEEGNQYKINSLNHPLGIQTFREMFPTSKAIPTKLTTNVYDRVKKGYVLAVLMPSGTFDMNFSNSTSFAAGPQNNTKKRQVDGGTTSLMKKMKMSTTSSSSSSSSNTSSKTSKRVVSSSNENIKTSSTSPTSSTSSSKRTAFKTEPSDGKTSSQQQNKDHEDIEDDIEDDIEADLGAYWTQPLSGRRRRTATDKFGMSAYTEDDFEDDDSQYDDDSEDDSDLDD